MSSWTYGLGKTWLDKCLKTLVSEDPLRTNMGNALKDCSNLNDSTFTIIIDPCEYNSGWKSLSEWYAGSYDSFLTHWLPITSILFLIETIYRNIFRCNYVGNKKNCLDFFLYFRNLDSTLNIKKNIWTS